MKDIIGGGIGAVVNLVGWVIGIICIISGIATGGWVGIVGILAGVFIIGVGTAAKRKLSGSR